MKLTEEQKRIRIAEFCGWRKAKANFFMGMNTAPKWVTTWMLTKRKRLPVCTNEVKLKEGEMIVTDVTDLPDYFNSLDAIHEVEKRMTATQSLSYLDEIANVTEAGDAATEWYEASHYRLLVCNASAKHRAEAFGLTIGLWQADR